MKFIFNSKKLLTIICLLLMIPAGLTVAENITIQADKQTFDGETSTFEGNVKVDYEDVTIKSPRAVVNSNKEGKPETAKFFDGAYAVKKSGYSKNEVKANIINLSLLKNRIKAEGNAKSAVFENKKPIVDIEAGTQEFDIKKNIIVANENVIINYKDIKTNSDKARISINEEGNLDKVELLGKVTVYQGKSIIKASDVLYNPKTNEVVAYGNSFSETKLEDGSLVKIWSDFQQYDNLSKTLITSGHVKIKYKNYIATGPKATFIPEKGSDKPNRIVFIGRSKIQEDQRHVEADRIEITITPKNFTAEGNVRTRLTKVDSLRDMKKKK